MLQGPKMTVFKSECGFSGLVDETKLEKSSQCEEFCD